MLLSDLQTLKNEVQVACNGIMFTPSYEKISALKIYSTITTLRG